MCLSVFWNCFNLCVSSINLSFSFFFLAFDLIFYLFTFLQIIFILYCVKPIEGLRLAEHLHACNNFLITAEDHYPEGGLGEAVISALAEVEAAPARFKKLAVNGLPHSGKADELLDAFGISSRHIAEAVRGS